MARKRGPEAGLGGAIGASRAGTGSLMAPRAANSLTIVKFSNENRLNPIPREGVDESTLGGYPAVHGRAAAFEGGDGHPYTVAIETEPAEDGSDDWVAYLVFLRWAAGGSVIMGHLESDDLARGGSRDAALRQIEELPLARAKSVLDTLIARKAESGPDAGDWPIGEVPDEGTPERRDAPRDTADDEG